MSKGQKFYAKIKDLLPLLKKVFIDYYGKEYKDKITSTLESVRFVITDSRGNFFENAGDYNNVLEQDRRKIFEAKISGDIEKYGGCVVKDIFPPVIVLDDTGNVILHYLIHEINHALHMRKETFEFSYLMLKLGTKTKIGFSNMANDYLYEIINEYMTFEILNIAKKYISDDFIKNSGISMEFNKNCYLYLDDAVDNYVYKIYNEDRDKIKKVLIEHSGDKYYSEFGENNWDSISYNLKRIKGLFIYYFCHTDTFSKDEDTLYREAKENLSTILKTIKKQIIMNNQSISDSSTNKRK